MKTIKFGAVIILLTPLVLGPFGLTFSAYPKAVFFRFLVEIIFIFYLILVFLNQRYLPKSSPIFWSILLFLVILVSAGLTGINFHRSLFGDPERAEGIILHIHLFIFFLILASIFKDRKEWIGLLKTAVVVSGISSFVGVLQKYGVGTFYGIDVSERVSGTLSNPDFFAPYIVLSIFMAIFLVFSEQ